MNPFLTHISSDGLVDSTTNPRKEFYHLLVALLDYCVARLPASMVKPGPSGEHGDHVGIIYHHATHI